MCCQRVWPPYDLFDSLEIHSRRLTVNVSDPARDDGLVRAGRVGRDGASTIRRIASRRQTDAGGGRINPNPRFTLDPQCSGSQGLRL